MRARVTMIAGLVCSLAVAAEPLPLFDGHIHYGMGAPQEYSPQQVIEIFNRSGISRALVSSTPNAGTRKLYEAFPERVVPSLRPYHRTNDLTTWTRERASWYRNPATVEFIERELQRGIYRAIGEFHVNGNEVDTPVMRRIVDIAVAAQLPLHAHSDLPAIQLLFEFNPAARIIWAHAGMNATPADIGAMLQRYPALWAELSYRDDIAPGGKLDSAWRELFLRYPERFMAGSDTWIPARFDEVERIAGDYRGWLAQLPEGVARRIAHDNLAELFPPP
jgi:hypothetical protein